MIVNYLDDTHAGEYEAAVNCLLKAIQALKIDNKDSLVCELLERARRPGRFDIVFDLRSKTEMENIEERAERAEALTGLFFAHAPFFVTRDAHGPEGEFLRGPLNAVDIGRLRNRHVQVVIVLNSAVIQANKEKGLHSLGNAVQVLVHEWCVHGVKYLQCADMFLRSEVSDTQIETYLRNGFIEASTFEGMLGTMEGYLSPRCQHLRFGLSEDKDYEALRKKVNTVFMSLGMSVEHQKSFEKRDCDDKTLYMDSLRSHFKAVQNEQKKQIPAPGFNRFKK